VDFSEREEGLEPSSACAHSLLRLCIDASVPGYPSVVVTMADDQMGFRARVFCRSKRRVYGRPCQQKSRWPLTGPFVSVRLRRHSLAGRPASLP